MPINNQIPRIERPFCFLVFARAPEGMKLGDANRIFNEYSADPARGLALYHDHFIGKPGGIAIFYAESADHRQALSDPGELADWEVEVWPMNHSFSPSSFDEQIAYTVHNYGKANWNTIRMVDRPSWVPDSAPS